MTFKQLFRCIKLAAQKEQIQVVPGEAGKNLLSVVSITITWLCKNWKLPNSRIWLPKSDIDRSLDFPI